MNLPSLVIDGSHLLHRTLHMTSKESPNSEGVLEKGLAYSEMSNSEGEPTGGVYGLLKSLRGVMRDFTPSSIVFVWDGYPRALSSRRLELFPGYKQSRVQSQDPEDLKYRDIYVHQRKLVDEILCDLGIIPVNIAGREGDDVVAIATKMISGPILVMTEDKDYFQLISDRVHLWRPIQQKYMTLESFESQTQIKTPERYLLYAAIVGDGSDEIPGIKGVGSTTAMDIVNKVEHAHWADVEMFVHKMTKPVKRYQIILDNMQRIIDNLELMDLHREKMTVSDIRQFKDTVRSQDYGKVNDASVLQFFNRLEFKSYLNYYTTWAQAFRLLVRPEIDMSQVVI